MKALLYPALAGWLASLAISSAQPSIRSDFETGSENWRIADLTSTGPYVTALAYYTVQWQSGGGCPGPFIDAGDPTSNAFSFDAPAKFLGDLSAYTNGAILFSLRSSHSNWAGDNVLVLVGRIGGSSRAIVSTINPLPWTNWGAYAIPLRPVAFKYDNKNGAALTAADFRSVLTNVTALRISAEYGSAVQETVALDSVEILVRPRLDIARPATPAVLSWPGWATNFQLEATASLSAPAWSDVPDTPVLALSRLWVTNTIDPGPRFYRLRRLE